MAVALVVITVALHAAGFSLLLPGGDPVGLPPRHQHDDRTGILADPGSHVRDRHLGRVLLVARLSAGCRVGLLFLGCHLHDAWLWRLDFAAALADARPAGSVNRHSHVRGLGQSIFRNYQPMDWQLDEITTHTLNLKCGTRKKTKWRPEIMHPCIRNPKRKAMVPLL